MDSRRTLEPFHKRHPMLTQRIQKNYSDLPRQQKKVAEFFLSQGAEAAFLSVAQLSRRAGTSQATVVRFAKSIGLKGYPDLQRELQATVLRKISPTRILQSMISKKASDKIYDRIFEMDMQNLRQTQEANDPATLERAVKEIIRARKIGFIGARTSHALAYLLYYYLGRVRKHCELLDIGGNGYLTNQIMDFRRGDLLVGISFPRYGRHTIEILKCGKRRGCKIIVITDTPISPAAQVADLVLLAERKSATYFNSLASSITLLNYLAAEVSLKVRNSLTRFKSFDQMDKELSFEVCM